MDEQNTQDTNEGFAQGGDTETKRASCDVLLMMMNGALGKAQQDGFDFELSDVLGALQTMTIQVQEQILVNYRRNLASANAMKDSYQD